MNGPPPSPARARERGFALILVLWALAVLALVVARVSHSADAQARIAARLRGNLAAEALADAAVYTAAFHLLDGGGRGWVPDGRAHAVALPGGAVRVRISDEADEVDLNTASADLLRELLVGVHVDASKAARLAASIVAWRGDLPPGQAMAQVVAYRAAGSAYLPPGETFRSIAELGLVLGMTPDILRRLGPHVTIYPSYGPAAATSDRVVAGALARVRATAGVLPLQGLDGRVRFVRIVAASVAPDGGRFVRDAVLRLDPGAKPGGVVRVLAWRHGGDPGR